MISRRIFLICAGALVATMLLTWRWGPASATRVDSVQAPSPSHHPTRTASTEPQASPQVRKQLPGGPYEGSDPRWKWWWEQARRDPAWDWKRPINFFGKVVGDKEQPIAGASIDFDWTDLSEAGTSKQKTVSDNQGLFSLRSQSGKSLQVTVKKDGYYSPKQSRLRSFEYADFSQADYYEPDPNNPVLFKLLKKGSGVPLLKGELLVSIPPDGASVRFDLLNGAHVDPEGQLEISAVTNREKYPPRYFDWHASIAVPGGGLLEFNQEFPFEAPSEGYSPKVEFNFRASDTTNWKRSITKSYFITWGSPPNYGRIQIRFNGASLHPYIQYWVNPNGSTNLEPVDEQR